MWEDPPACGSLNWDGAVSCCDGLVHLGFDDWHLPTIGDLRSFVRGCPATMTGGSCGVTDTCLDGPCRDSQCDGCGGLGGPGAGGCYWDPLVAGECAWFWSSSSYAGGASSAWVVTFNLGYVGYYGKSYTYYVRCVRRRP